MAFRCISSPDVESGRPCASPSPGHSSTEEAQTSKCTQTLKTRNAAVALFRLAAEPCKESPWEVQNVKVEQEAVPGEEGALRS